MRSVTWTTDSVVTSGPGRALPLAKEFSLKSEAAAGHLSGPAGRGAAARLDRSPITVSQRPCSGCHRAQNLRPRNHAQRSWGKHQARVAIEVETTSSSGPLISSSWLPRP
jgi:hypothetical protein